MRAGASKDSKGSVLVIEDDERVREAVSHVLQQRGFHVEPCPDSVAAFLHLRAGRRPDVILLDLMMPGIDGWEFRLIQKGVSRWADIPVIVMSADKSAKAAAIDADAFLPKPISHKALLETVERLSRVSQRRAKELPDADLERLRSLGNLASVIAEQVGKPIPTVLADLKLAQQKSLELEGRMSKADASSLLSVRQLLASAERGAERVQAVLQGASTFVEVATQVATGKRRILIVHSDLRMAQLIQQSFGTDTEVLMPTSDATATEALLEDGFDVVLCEFALLGPDGIAVYETLARKKPELARRIVFLTGGSPGERECAFFREHRPLQLRSPFNTTELRDVVEAPWRGMH